MTQHATSTSSEALVDTDYSEPIAEPNQVGDKIGTTVPKVVSHVDLSHSDPMVSSSTISQKIYPTSNLKAPYPPSLLKARKIDGCRMKLPKQPAPRTFLNISSISTKGFTASKIDDGLEEIGLGGFVRYREDGSPAFTSVASLSS